MFRRGRGARRLKWAAAILLLYGAAFILVVSQSRVPDDTSRDTPQLQHEGRATSDNLPDTRRKDTPNGVSTSQKADVFAGELKTSQILALQNVTLYSSNARHLRALESHTYGSVNKQGGRTVSGFLTRVYDEGRVARADGRMEALQLLEYYNQKARRMTARLRVYNGIIDMDNKALNLVSYNESVDEMLLLLFNDWDYAADKYLDILNTLGAKLQMFETSPKEDIPKIVLDRMGSVGVSVSHVASLRRNAFKDLLKIDGNTTISRRSSYGIFLWPKSTSSASPAHIIAAIRPVDFDGVDLFGRSTIQHTFQSPSIFFFSKSTKRIQPYRGPASLKHVIDFVITNSNSNFQLMSSNELGNVLRRFDRLALIICKDAEYDADRLSSPLRDILFSKTVELRHMLGAVRPTFFVQEEDFRLDVPVDWSAPEIVHTEQLQPNTLRFMGKNAKNGLPNDFIDKLDLLPIKDTVRVLVLDRVQLSRNGERGTSLSDFIARVLYFPAPSKKSDHNMWSNTFGMRLVDFVRDGGSMSPPLIRVTGLDFQQVYEKHFQQSYADVHKRSQRASSMTPNRETDRRLVAVILPQKGDSGGGEVNCEKAAFNAARAARKNSRIKFVTVAAVEAPALVEELRFSVWRHSKNGKAKHCEVYAFDANGVVHAMDITPEELGATENDWMKYFSNETDVQGGSDSTSVIAHPTPQDLRDATAELRKDMHKVTLPAPHMTFRSSLYGGSAGFAPWFLWLPPFETVPLLVHVQKQEHNDTSKEISLILIHDSSCGAATNSLKAFRLFEKCEEGGSLRVPIVMVELDLAENYITPDTNGQLLRGNNKVFSETRRHALYERLKSFLKNPARLKPPQLLALNSTHVISTLGVLPQYAKHNETGEANSHNSHVWRIAHFASHMDQLLKAEALYDCMSRAMQSEQVHRRQYRIALGKTQS